MATRYDRVDYTFLAVTPADAAAAMFGGGAPAAEAARQRMLERMGLAKPEPESANEARLTMVDRTQRNRK